MPKTPIARISSQSLQTDALDIFREKIKQKGSQFLPRFLGVYRDKIRGLIQGISTAFHGSGGVHPDIIFFDQDTLKIDSKVAKFVDWNKQLNHLKLALRGGLRAKIKSMAPTFAAHRETLKIGLEKALAEFERQSEDVSTKKIISENLIQIHTNKERLYTAQYADSLVNSETASIPSLTHILDLMEGFRRPVKIAACGSKNYIEFEKGYENTFAHFSTDSEGTHFYLIDYPKDEKKLYELELHALEIVLTIERLMGKRISSDNSDPFYQFFLNLLAAIVELDGSLGLYTYLYPGISESSAKAMLNLIVSFLNYPEVFKLFQTVGEDKFHYAGCGVFVREGALLSGQLAKLHTCKPDSNPNAIHWLMQGVLDEALEERVETQGDRTEFITLSDELYALQRELRKLQERAHNEEADLDAAGQGDINHRVQTIIARMQEIGRQFSRMHLPKDQTQFARIYKQANPLRIAVEDLREHLIPLPGVKDYDALIKRVADVKSDLMQRSAAEVADVFLRAYQAQIGLLGAADKTTIGEFVREGGLVAGGIQNYLSEIAKKNAAFASQIQTEISGLQKVLTAYLKDVAEIEIAEPKLLTKSIERLGAQLAGIHQQAKPTLSYNQLVALDRQIPREALAELKACMGGMKINKQIILDIRKEVASLRALIAKIAETARRVDQYEGTNFFAQLQEYLRTSESVLMQVNNNLSNQGQLLLLKEQVAQLTGNVGVLGQQVEARKGKMPARYKESSKKMDTGIGSIELLLKTLEQEEKGLDKLPGKASDYTRKFELLSRALKECKSDKAKLFENLYGLDNWFTQHLDGIEAQGGKNKDMGHTQDGFLPARIRNISAQVNQALAEVKKYKRDVELKEIRERVRKVKDALSGSLKEFTSRARATHGDFSAYLNFLKAFFSPIVQVYHCPDRPEGLGFTDESELHRDAKLMRRMTVAELPPRPFSEVRDALTKLKASLEKLVTNASNVTPRSDLHIVPSGLKISASSSWLNFIHPDEFIKVVGEHLKKADELMRRVQASLSQDIMSADEPALSQMERVFIQNLQELKEHQSFDISAPLQKGQINKVGTYIKWFFESAPNKLQAAAKLASTPTPSPVASPVSVKSPVTPTPKPSQHIRSLPPLSPTAGPATPVTPAVRMPAAADPSSLKEALKTGTSVNPDALSDALSNLLEKDIDANELLKFLQQVIREINSADDDKLRQFYRLMGALGTGKNFPANIKNAVGITLFCLAEKIRAVADAKKKGEGLGDDCVPESAQEFYAYASILYPRVARFGGVPRAILMERFRYVLLESVLEKVPSEMRVTCRMFTVPALQVGAYTPTGASEVQVCLGVSVSPTNRDFIRDSGEAIHRYMPRWACAVQAFFKHSSDNAEKTMAATFNSADPRLARAVFNSLFIGGRPETDRVKCLDAVLEDRKMVL
ncbi:MAG: hypothetical protein K0S08_199 [Gammaproteobacteria bacterium]|jgi:hypothetical protein|nr:hypothetical protein [Gammaproteobacteria bacterium]